MKASVRTVARLRPARALTFGLLFVAGTAGAASAQDAMLIDAARRVSVASLDPAYPRLQFEAWLAALAGVPRSAITWEVNDCGEGGDGRAAPTCVEAGVELAPDTVAHASLMVAGLDGSRARPAVWMLSVGSGGTFSELKTLDEWAAFVRAHKR